MPRRPRDRVVGTTARTCTTLGVAAAGLALLAPAAQATFPGANGPIAFQRFVDRRDDENSQVFSVARPGAPAKRLTHGGSGFNPDYSPDGTRLAFERRFGGVRPDALVVAAADGSSAAEVTTTCTADPCFGDNSPAWTPDGHSLVFERAFGPVVKDMISALDLYTVATDSGAEALVRHFGLQAPGSREPHDAQVSPDGTRVAYTALNARAKPRNASAIHVLALAGGAPRRITPMRLNAGNADWSPDGRRIVFNSSYEGQGRVAVYTVRPDGTGLRRLRREPKDVYAFEPVWSPDGTRIAFVRRTVRTPPHIWTTRRDGTDLRQVTSGPKPDVRPDWGPAPAVAGG